MADVDRLSAITAIGPLTMGYGRYQILAGVHATTRASILPGIVICALTAVLRRGLAATVALMTMLPRRLVQEGVLAVVKRNHGWLGMM